MSWRDQLRDASFRGVPFQVDSGRNTGGRRANVIEFPLRDDPQVDDLGARARSFSLEAYVLGADYMAARDGLIDALHKPGPGTLVHPYFGELDVQIGDVDWAESTKEGGMCRFNIQCYKASAALYPRTEADTRAKAATSIDAAETAATDAFSAAFGVDDFPDFVSAAAVARVGDIVTGVNAVISKVTTLPADLAILADTTSGLASAAASLVFTPVLLAGRIKEVFNQLLTAASQPRGAFEALRSLFGFGDDLDAVPGPTPSRQREADNQVAMTQLVQQLATLEAARAAAQADYESFDDAVVVRAALIEQLDKLTEQDISDAIYQALVATRVAIARDITARGADLARLVRIRLPESLPALTLAWTLYGDADRADEIVARNRPRDPLFLPAGISLETLDA